MRKNVLLGAHLAAALLATAGSAFASDLPSDLDQRLRSRLEAVLADPYSAQIKLTKDPWVDNAHFLDRDYPGNYVCVSINAKNRFGAYVGFRRYLFILQESGNIVVLDETAPLAELTEVLHSKCG